MSTRSKHHPEMPKTGTGAPCAQSPTAPRWLTWPEAVVVIVIVVTAAVLAASGTTTHTILALLGGAAAIGAAATTRSAGRIAAFLRRALAATA
ncbi:hypothetical protein [Streptacidiphilus carbonis]|uniref:hypothetical protein n=1 Tax=Streptacidiphilus carbonis TaxID=105422 RepID=UPI000A41DA5B|nr:hypothetical protein [Streptacidiphilus carbonis]